MTAIKLPLSFDAVRLQEDLRLVEEREWLRHFKKIHYEGNWSSVALISSGGSSADIRSTTGDFVPTEVLKRCPYFQEVIASFECPLRRVRLLKLDAGAVIKPHVDREGVDFGIARLHVPIVTNERVEFTSAGRKFVMRAGECWFLDASYSHSVRNLGGHPRIHLVLDCEVNDFVTRLLGVDLRSGRWRRTLGHRIRYAKFRLIDSARLLVYDRQTLRRVVAEAFQRS